MLVHSNAPHTSSMTHQNIHTRPFLLHDVTEIVKTWYSLKLWAIQHERLSTDVKHKPGKDMLLQVQAKMRIIPPTLLCSWLEHCLNVPFSRRLDVVWLSSGLRSQFEYSRGKAYHVPNSGCAIFRSSCKNAAIWWDGQVCNGCCMLL